MPEAADVALRRLRFHIGRLLRDARLARRWTVEELARKAGVSRGIVYMAERGDPISIEACVRLSTALGLRIDVDLVDPRRRVVAAVRQQDPVHSAMGEFEAGRLRQLRFPLAIDEPYQHFQFAGRADVAAWSLEERALLHIENRTRFPARPRYGGYAAAASAIIGRR